MPTSLGREKKGGKSPKAVPTRGKKKALPALPPKEDSKLKEILQQVAEAAFTVAAKTGFQGSFIHFLEELNQALEAVIRRDISHRGEDLH
jgi:hypothetical protein